MLDPHCIMHIFFSYNPHVPDDQYESSSADDWDEDENNAFIQQLVDDGVLEVFDE